MQLVFQDFNKHPPPLYHHFTEHPSFTITDVLHTEISVHIRHINVSFHHILTRSILISSASPANQTSSIFLQAYCKGSQW